MLSIAMHAVATEAKICSAEILMLLQAAESEEGSRQSYAFARRRDAESGKLAN
jgi:hypothetical protein